MGTISIDDRLLESFKQSLDEGQKEEEVLQSLLEQYVRQRRLERFMKENKG